jgi:hypothetical protein
MAKGQRRAIPAPGGPDPLERRQADWDATVREFREALREGHELLGALRAERAEAQRVLAVCEPAALAAVADERIAGALDEGLAGYRAKIATAIGDAEARVFARFDKLVAALMGDEDADGGLEAALHRFQDRQRVLEAAVLRAPGPAAEVLTAPDGGPVL